MLDQGRFSGAGMADDPQKFSPFHLKAHILHGAALKGRAYAVSMGQVFDF